MRILIVGAGAIGGYFGGRLLAAKRDVTFLVRPRRAEELARDGLVITSPAGDLTVPSPPIVQAQDLKTPFDVVLLSCKAFDLDDAIASFAPAVGPQTAIIPVLNGMKHLDVLDSKFGRAKVLGGQCVIASTLNAQRHIVHLAPMQELTFGERDGGVSERVRKIAESMKGAGFAVTTSDAVMQDMWEKWVFLATLAGATSVMRAPVGSIVAAPGGEDFLRGLLDECASIAAAAGHAPREPFFARVNPMLAMKGSPLTASMARDIAAGAAIEADQIIGDLIARAEAAKAPVPKLRLIYTHLKAYEAQRA